MSLDRRLTRLEEAHHQVARRGNSDRVPTENFAAFVRGFLTGAFTVDDLDPCDAYQTSLLGEMWAYFALVSPDARGWEERCDWGKVIREQFERDNLPDFTPEELARLRALARIAYPPEGETAGDHPEPEQPKEGEGDGLERQIERLRGAKVTN